MQLQVCSDDKKNCFLLPTDVPATNNITRINTMFNVTNCIVGYILSNLLHVYIVQVMKLQETKIYHLLKWLLFDQKGSRILTIAEWNIADFPRCVWVSCVAPWPIIEGTVWVSAVCSRRSNTLVGEKHVGIVVVLIGCLGSPILTL